MCEEFRRILIVEKSLDAEQSLEILDMEISVRSCVLEVKTCHKSFGMVEY